MARPSLPQFEPDYDFYKMRQLVDEMNRWIDTVEAGESGATPPPVTGVHNDLTGRSALDAHPITAITGLIASLAGLATDIASNTAVIGAHIADATIHFTVGSIDHGSIAGLGDDDHPQYGQIATAENVTGAWTFRHPLEIRALEVGTTPPVPGDNFNAQLRFANITGTNQIGAVGYNGISGNLLVGNEVHGGRVILSAQDAAGVSVIGLDFDPDAALTLTGDTGAFLTGGKLAGELLTLQGSSSSPDVGIIVANSPITLTYDTISNTTPAESFAMKWDPTVTISALYVGGVLEVAPVVTVTTGVYVPATFSDTSSVLTAATPAFSAFTFINELAVIRNSGNFNLPSALVINVGLTHERNTAGTSTTPGTTGLSFSPQTRSTISGGVMTKTDQTALRCSVSFSTVVGATANLGTVRGAHLFNPAVALFQPGTGAETATAIIGLDVNNLAFGGNIVKAAVRSAHVSTGVNSYFLLNTGNAQSNFNSSHLFDVGIVQHLGDGILFSNSWGAAGGDLLTYWDGTGYTWNPLVGLDTLYRFDASGMITTAVTPSTAQWRLGHERFAFGQTGIVGNQVGLFVANTRTAGVPGGWADFLLTQAGSLTLGVFAMSDVSAWVVNAISFANTAYTITELATFRVGGMTTSNPGGTVTERAALWVRGRHMQEGSWQTEPINPAAFAAGNNNDWAGLLTGSPSNNTRLWARVTLAATAVLTGIDSTAVQDGDTFEITNVDAADALSITHQDAASVAANRIITPTGVAYTLGINETVWIKYDSTTVRWRLLAGTGA